MFQRLRSRGDTLLGSLLVVIASISMIRSAVPETATPEMPNAAASQQPVGTTFTPASDSSRRSSEGAEAEARARETEQQMNDDERFALIISLVGPATGLPRDKRIPENVK